MTPEEICKEVADWLLPEASDMNASVDVEKYPHSCPNCGSPAYVGFTQVDCFVGCK